MYKKDLLFAAVKKTILKLEGKQDRHESHYKEYKITAIKYQHYGKTRLRVEIYKNGGRLK